MTFTDILNSFKTLGFCVGAATALLVFIILHIWWLIRRWKKNRQFVTIPDANGGEFKLSYGAIRSQLHHKLRRAFPELSVAKILLARHRDGMKMTIKAQTSELANIKALRATVRSTIERILVQEDGFDGVFNTIDVEIIDINAKIPKNQGAPAIAMTDEVPAAPQHETPPLPPQDAPLPPIPAGEAPAE